MILKFSCSNYRSIKEKIIFSMSATSDQEHLEQVKSVDSIRVLRNIALYGANGSGKSSFICAIKELQRLVGDSINFQPGDLITRSPHKLSVVTEPTFFEMQFIKDDVRYLYGVSFTDEEIMEEYLYYYPSGRQAKIFDRDVSGITFGEKFKKDIITVIQNILKPNRLLLSCMANFSNVKEIEKVFLFFKEDIIIYQNSVSDNGLDKEWIKYTAKTLKNSAKIKEIFLLFLQLIGTDVKDIDAGNISNNAYESYLANLVGDENQKVGLKINYGKFSIELDDESEGIKKLFKILCPIINVIVSGKVLIIDEIETSLHPSIVREIIRLFSTHKKEEFAQLIFSTHDAMLLDLGLFRRDQIWFTELKSEERSTDLYSLAELKNIRKDENIMKGYMLGKYGAIPMINHEITQIFNEE